MKDMKKKKEPNPQIVRGEILKIVQNQIRDNDPPETKETLNRLKAEGISEEEAKKMIGCVVSTEIFNVLKYKEGFNRERYKSFHMRLVQLCSLTFMPFG